MLRRLCIENFMNFRDKVTLDLYSSNDYAFHTEVISESCITKGFVYGPNGSGKSNLGLAIFDITLHLTDREHLTDKYRYTLNLTAKKNCARFEYTFRFFGKEVLYKYQKASCNKLIEEHLFIDGDEV